MLSHPASTSVTRPTQRAEQQPEDKKHYTADSQAYRRQVPTGRSAQCSAGISGSSGKPFRRPGDPGSRATN